MQTLAKSIASMKPSFMVTMISQCIVNPSYGEKDRRNSMKPHLCAQPINHLSFKSMS